MGGAEKTFKVRFRYPLPKKGDRTPIGEGLYVPGALQAKSFTELTTYEAKVLDFLVFKTYGNNRRTANVSYSELSEYVDAWGKRPSGWRGCGKTTLPQALSVISKRGLAEIIF